MSEMIDISKLKTWDKPHKMFIPSKYGVFVKRADLEKLLETAHSTDYTAVLEQGIFDYAVKENKQVPVDYRRKMAAHLNSVLQNQNCV